MADVNVDIYRQPQINPLDQAGKTVGLVNALQGLQLQRLQMQGQGISNVTGQQQQDQAFANDLMTTAGTLANRPGITRDQALGAVLDRAKQIRAPGNIVDIATQGLRDPNLEGPKLTQYLGNLGARAAGPGGILSRAPTIGPQGEQYSTPGPALIGANAPTGLSPAAGAAATQYGGAAGGVLGSEAVNNTDYRRQVTPLEQAIPALQRLGKTGTGPGKDEVNQMKSVAVAFGFAPDKWTGTVKDFDESKKYLTDWVRANGDTSTNDKLAASFSSNASVNISNAAAVDVAKTALAIRRMKYMQLQEFYKSGLSPDQFPKFASQWNAQHDPRAFGFDHLNPTQRKQILDSLPAAKRSMFKMDVQNADNAGVLTNQ